MGKGGRGKKGNAHPTVRGGGGGSGSNGGEGKGTSTRRAHHRLPREGVLMREVLQGEGHRGRVYALCGGRGPWGLGPRLPAGR